MPGLHSNPPLDGGVDRRALAAALGAPGQLDLARLTALEGELAQRGDLPALEALYQLAIPRAPDPDIGRELMLKAGLLAKERLGAPALAEAYLRRVLSTDPGNPDAIEGLRSMLEEQNRLEEAAALLDAAIAATPDAEKVELLIALAEIAHGGLDQPERALAALGYAYRLAPARLDVLHRARALFIAEGRLADAKGVLDAEADARLGRPSIAPEDLRALGEAYRALGVRLFEAPLDHGVARDALERARQLQDPEAPARLDALLQFGASWEARARAMMDEAHASRDERRAAELYVGVAEILLAYANDALRADDVLMRALTLIPGFPPALRLIERAVRDPARAGAAVAKLMGAAADIKEPAARARTFLRAARIAVSIEAGQPDTALSREAYRRVFALDPSQSEAAFGYAARLGQAGAFDEQAKVLERHLGVLDTPHAKLGVHLELGRVYAQQLGDPMMARAHLEQALRIQPGNFAAASALRAIYRELSLPRGVLDMGWVLLEHAPERRARVALLDEMIPVARALSREDAHAALLARYALEPEPTLEPELEAAAEAVGKGLELAALALELAEHGPPALAVDRLAMAGRLFDRAGRPREAIEAKKRVLAARPKDRAVREDLERLLLDAQDPRALAEILELQIARASVPAEGAALLVKLASVRENELGDRSGARSALERRVALEPNNAAALAELDALYQRMGLVAERAPVLAAREALARGPERAELAAIRAQILGRHVGDLEGAAAAGLSAIAERPDDAPLVELLQELCARGVRAVEIAAALEPIYADRASPSQQLEALLVLSGAAEAAGDRARLAELSRREAKLLARLDRSSEALTALARAVTADPNHPETLDSFVRLARAGAAADGAVRVLRGLLADPTLTPASASAVSAQLASLLEELGRRDEAIAVYESAIEDDGANAVALAALERLLGESGRHGELAGLLAERMSRTEDRAARVELGLRIAQLDEAQGGDLGRALSVIEGLVALAPSDPRPIARLGELLARVGSSEGLVAAIDRLAAGLEDPSAKDALDLRAAELERRAPGGGRSAFARYARVLARRPGDELAVEGLTELAREDASVRADAAAELARLHRGSDRPQALAEALRLELSATEAQAPRKALVRELSALEREVLKQPQSSWDTLVAGYAEGLVDREELVRAGVAAGQGAQVAALLDANADPEDLALARQIAGLYEAAGAARAAAAWERVLALAPDDETALDALERHRASGDDPAALADVVLARARMKAGTDAAALYKRAAGILEEAVEDLAGARAALEAAIAADPLDRQAVAELQRVAGRLGDGARVIELRRREAELVVDPREQADVWLRLAGALTDEGRHEEAVETYAKVLAIAPDRALAREGLESLLVGPAAPLAARALEPIYTRAQDWPRLVELHQRLVGLAARPEERVAHLSAIRALWEERLKNPERAFQAATLAFRELPTHEDTLASLERLARPARAHEDLLALYEDEAERHPTHSPARVFLLTRLARLLESLRIDKKLVLSAWRRVASEAPRDPGALEAVARVGTELGAFDVVVQALELLSELLEDPRARLDKLRAAARILEIQSGDPGRVAEIYERALELAPGDPEALARLETLYAQAGRFAELSRVLTEAVERAQPGPAQIQLRLRLARLCASRLEQPEAALEGYARVLAEEGGGQESLLEAAVAGVEQILEASKASRPALAARAAALIEPIWRKRGVPAKLVEAKKAQAEAATDLAERRRLTLEVAALYERELSQPELAFLTLTRLYEEHPGDTALGAELDRLSRVADTREELADLFAGVIDEVEDETAALQMARLVAQVYDRELSRAADAIPFYERVLARAPDDAEVLKTLERAYRGAKDARGLARTLRRRLELAGTSPDDRKAIADELAKILATELRDVDGALEAHRARLAVAPDDRSAWTALAELAGREGRHEIFAEAIERLLTLSERPDERAALLLRLAKAQREGLRDPALAVATLARALEAKKNAPGALAELAAIFKEGGVGRARAAEVLAPVLEDNGAYSDLVVVLEGTLADATPEERKARLSKIAVIYGDRMGRVEQGFNALCRAAHEDPSDAELRDRLERIAREASLAEDLAAFYLDEVDQTMDAELAVELRQRAAALYERDLKDVDRAIAEHTRVLEVMPGDQATLEALERLYQAKGQFQSLAEIYRRRIAQAEDLGERARLMRELARVQADSLKESSAAIATLRRLLELTPDDLAALERLVALCARENRPTELADALERLISAADSQDAPADDHRLALAKLRFERLEDRVGGDALIRDILARDPKHAGARAYLRERLEDAVGEDDGRQAVQLADLLAKAHREAGDPQALIEVLRVRVGLTPDREAKLALHKEIAALYAERLAQPELAFGALTQAFREDPSDPELASALERLARELVMVEELVEIYEEALPRLAGSDAGLALEARVAALYEGSLGNREKALASWESVLRRRPMDPAALEALDRLNGQLGRWGALTDVLEKRLELAEGDPGAVFDVLIRLGQVWEERLDEPAEAAATYRRARSIAPEEPRVLRALVRLLDPKADADELWGVLEGLSAHAEPSERKELYPRMAQLAAEHLGDRPRAISLWKELLELERDNPTAPLELERLYELDEQWGELVALLERQLKAAKDEQKVARVSRKLALIRGTRLGKIDDAIESWTGILRKNPSDLEALDALQKIYRSAGRWDDAVATIRKMVPLQSQAGGVKALRFELADIFLNHLKKRDDAVEATRRALDVEPHDHAELVRLEELFLAAEAYADAARVMQLRVEFADDAGEKVDVLFAIAELFAGKLARKQGAAQAFEKILEIQPGNTRAYERLAAIYEQAGDYRKLVELMSRRLEHIEDPDGRRNLLFTIIDVQETRLGLKSLAFGSACRAFGEHGADERAQAIAERLAAETDGWEILGEVIEAQIDDVPVPRGVALRRRLAEICVRHLDELPRAEKLLDRVLELAPDDDEARAQLADIYEKTGRFRDFISITTARIEASAELGHTKKLLRDIAQIEEKELGDLDAAIRTHWRILGLEPADEAPLDEVIRLLEQKGDARALIDALQARADRREDDAERAEVRFRVGLLWEERLSEPDRAIDAYREVLALVPAHEGALEALERVFTRESRFEDLVEVFEHQVQLADSPEKAVASLNRIAKVQDAELGEPSRAAITLDRALEMLPRHVPTMEALEPILSRLGVWSRLVEIYERHIAEVKDRDRAIELHLALGEVQDRELERRDLAERSYQAALAKDPSHPGAIHRLGELFERQGSWSNALEMLSKEARLAAGRPESVEIHHRIGKLNADMLGDIPSAKLAFRRAIEADPAHLPSIRALAEIFRDESRWDEVLALEIQEAEATPGDTERATRWQRAAETAFDRLERPDEARRLYERALEADEGHEASLRALGDLCFVEERFERADELLTRLVGLLDPAYAKDELCRQHYRLAYISEKLGDEDRALRHYQESHELDSSYLPTLEGLAAALLRAEKWEEAQAIYQAILVHHRDSLTDAEVVDLYYQLGDLAQRLGDHEKARRSFDRSLELDPNHVNTLRAYAALAEELGEWEEAYDHRARLIDLVPDEARFDALIAQAKLSRSKIQDPYRAVDALSEARRLRPKHAGVLRELAKLYPELSQHARAVEVLTDLVALTEEPAARRDLYLKIADAEEAQGSVTKTVEALSAALDADPSHVAAFARIEALLAKEQRWPQLEEQYRRMIERLPKDASQNKAKAVLWRSLGDLYRLKLKNPTDARVAYEVVLKKLNPNDHDVAFTLAELLEKKRETLGDAIQIYQSLLSKVNEPAAHIRKIFPIYHEMNQQDRVTCALGALVIMQAAQPLEQRLYESRMKDAPALSGKVLDDKAWRNHLFHPDCRNGLADLLSVLYRGAPDLFATAQNDLALKKKERVDLAGKSARAGLYYFGVWRNLATAMGLTEVDHYHRPGVATAPRLYPGPTPVLFAGELHDIFREMPPKHVSWVLCREMACLRPELAPVRALPPEEVAAAAEGAIRLFLDEGSKIDHGIDPRSILRWKENLQRSLGERAIKALRPTVEAVLKGKDMGRLKEYLKGVDHTASRAALLLSGDARVAERFLSAQDRIVDVSDRSRGRELVLFSMSDDFFMLRVQLGLAVASPPRPSMAPPAAGAPSSRPSPTSTPPAAPSGRASMPTTPQPSGRPSAAPPSASSRPSAAAPPTSTPPAARTSLVSRLLPPKK